MYHKIRIEKGADRMNLESEVLQVNLDDIIPNRFQPRIAFDETGLKELADSIKEHGIIQPLVLRKLGNKYEIIAGERRYKAATIAGLVTVPAIISNIDDNKSAEVALVENIQRRDLTPIEEAKSYKSLLDKGYLTQEQLAKKMGISQPAVANKLRLLNLDEEIQQALLTEKISERHARSLLQVTDKTKQKELLNRIINERLTVRDLDQEIKKILETNDDSGTIPLVSLTPSIDEIKTSAQDINIDKPSIDFMTPSSITNSLNNEEITNVTKEQQDGKFFNFNSMEALNDITPNSNLNNNIEIIDVPPVIENKKIETKDIKESEEKSTEKVDSIIDSSLNLSSNNKFFTPFLEETSMNDILSPKEEVLIDPMDKIGLLDSNIDDKLVIEDKENINSIPSNSKEENLADIIVKTRELVEEFKKKGITINTEEIDLLNQYKITITIEK